MGVITIGTGSGSLYEGYAYSYPHKGTYRPFDPAESVADVWAVEDRSALFCYVHIPICEMRCGFCNLFTVANPPDDLAGRYLDRLARQMANVTGAIGPSTFRRLAVGGGTPTMLGEPLLARLIDQLINIGADPATMPGSIETSPATATAGKLAMLADAGFTRVSIGVQTMIDAESRRLARPQSREQVSAALDTIARSGVPELNVDLIYGIENQTASSFVDSIEQVLRWEPAEVYLYPLYVRPLTGLGLSTRRWDDHRLGLYRVGRDRLLAAGFRQLSMRVFRRETLRADVPDYSCQDDGMIGFGAGARSYTRSLHYSSEYAVPRPEVVGIIEDYIAQPDEHDERVYHGVRLDTDEEMRRYAIKSVLRRSGLEVDRFTARFGVEPETAVAELRDLLAEGWLRRDDRSIRPTARGLERSDAMGPMLYSPAMNELAADGDAA